MIVQSVGNRWCHGQHVFLWHLSQLRLSKSILADLQDQIDLEGESKFERE